MRSPEVNEDPPADGADDFSFVFDLMLRHLLTILTFCSHLLFLQIPAVAAPSASEPAAPSDVEMAVRTFGCFF